MLAHPRDLINVSCHCETWTGRAEVAVPVYARSRQQDFLFHTARGYKEVSCAGSLGLPITLYKLFYVFYFESCSPRLFLHMATQAFGPGFTPAVLLAPIHVLVYGTLLGTELYQVRDDTSAEPSKANQEPYGSPSL